MPLGYFICQFGPGSAHSPHVPHVRSGCSALPVFKLAATIAPGGIAF
ncbi:L-asparaginase [Klebsiella michiganensis]|nr:L-asparaginase [Klebsiella michiganensis]